MAGVDDNKNAEKERNATELKKTVQKIIPSKKLDSTFHRFSVSSSSFDSNSFDCLGWHQVDGFGIKSILDKLKRKD